MVLFIVVLMGVPAVWAPFKFANALVFWTERGRQSLSNGLNSTIAVIAFFSFFPRLHFFYLFFHAFTKFLNILLSCFYEKSGGMGLEKGFCWINTWY